ncbi:hypothetical protein M427DRAFT_456102 [Gonapodya prolifera JEL478]|uniref:Uncharacterized protein n=1 Tax=Gonapodya prolifera (strain JEL478) TaxID=1344416 RepID=A0A139A2Q6_GONPJ|nr:hypothetical protein M427DRAFT_456102 [Gonapodya prolifera JEL478]|eukprot:KXS11031.1 hypothetical protein M427DRAFT_456102 [Gonapodya prolifera JEL478]
MIDITTLNFLSLEPAFPTVISRIQQVGEQATTLGTPIKPAIGDSAGRARAFAPLSHILGGATCLQVRNAAVSALFKMVGDGVICGQQRQFLDKYLFADACCSFSILRGRLLMRCDCMTFPSPLVYHKPCAVLHSASTPSAIKKQLHRLVVGILYVASRIAKSKSQKGFCFGHQTMDVMELMEHQHVAKPHRVYVNPALFVQSGRAGTCNLWPGQIHMGMPQIINIRERWFICPNIS